MTKQYADFLCKPFFQSTKQHFQTLDTKTAPPKADKYPTFHFSQFNCSLSVVLHPPSIANTYLPLPVLNIQCQYWPWSPTPIPTCQWQHPPMPVPTLHCQISPSNASTYPALPDLTIQCQYLPCIARSHPPMPVPTLHCQISPSNASTYPPCQ